MAEVLGPEYGALMGRTPEEALKLTMNYATSLEKKLGYDDEDDAKAAPDEPVNGLVVAKGMNSRSKEPIASEFVGNRAAAKAQARAQLVGEDPSFDAFDAHIEQVMSRATPEQQTDAANWVEAYWYLWGQAERLRKQNAKEAAKGDDDTPPGSVQTEDVIHDSRANASRGNPRGRQNQVDEFKIEDAEERRVKSQFERILGKKISNEEWTSLQDDAGPKTLEEYNELQERLGT